MSVKLFIIVSIILSNVSIIFGENFFDPENLINNGGFERQELHRWILKGNVRFTAERSYKGDYSLVLSNENLCSGYIFQHLEDPVKNYRLSFWFYPETNRFKSSFALVSDWDVTGLTEILTISLANDTTKISSSDTTILIPLNLKPRSWHRIMISSDSSGLKKTLYLNDDYLCSFSNIDISPIETLIIGEIFNESCLGTIYFDEITVFENSTDKSELSYPGVFASVGLGKTFVGPTFYFGVSYFSNAHLFSFRYLKGDEFQLSFGHPNYETPNENIKEFAILYGRYFKKKMGVASIAAGIGYIKAIERGGEGNKIEISTIGLVLDGQFRIIFSEYWGVGIAVVSNINDQKTIYGFSVNVQFGNI